MKKIIFSFMCLSSMYANAVVVVPHVYTSLSHSTVKSHINTTDNYVSHMTNTAKTITPNPLKSNEIVKSNMKKDTVVSSSLNSPAVSSNKSCQEKAVKAVSCKK